MLIIAISFVILALILCQMVGNFSSDTKSQTTRQSAETLSSYLNQHYLEDDDYEYFSQYIYFNRDDIEPMLYILADLNDDMLIIISDANGANLLASANIYGNIPSDSDIMSDLASNGHLTLNGNLGGVLSSDYLICAYPINNADGELSGAVFACSPVQGLDPLIETMVKTIIMSCLWVMLAALLAVYFISDKIIDPLKKMSKAAKSFAAGKFDVRVPVRGRDEVAELATAFNNMASSLASLEDMRRTFLANVSHDLRTPMTTISGFIDGIIDGAIPPEKHEYYLDVIRTEIRRLSRLVGNVLDFTLIHAGER